MTNIQKPTLLHSAALQLIQRGVAVFPCQPRGKNPACQRGVHEATIVADRINSWWGGCPDANIGIATGNASGFFVLDIDGEEGEASLRELEKKYNEPLPPTVESITGNDGRHLYFRLGPDPICNSAGTLGAGLDIRGIGGYVLAPPSVHPDTGRAYAWSVDSASDFADAPGWLLELVSTTEKQGKPLEHWHKTLTQKIVNGTRNSTMASIAGKLLFHDVNVALIHALLNCVNKARCEPPLSEAEIEGIVLSVSNKHFKEAHA
jgi:hypothetical protein